MEGDCGDGIRINWYVFGKTELSWSDRKVENLENISCSARIEVWCKATAAMES